MTPNCDPANPDIAETRLEGPEGALIAFGASGHLNS